MAAAAPSPNQNNLKLHGLNWDIPGRLKVGTGGSKSYVVIDITIEPDRQPFKDVRIEATKLIKYSAARIAFFVVSGVALMALGGVLLGKVGHLSQIPKNLHYLGIIAVVIAAGCLAYSAAMGRNNSHSVQTRKKDLAVEKARKENEEAQTKALDKRQQDQATFMYSSLQEKFKQDRKENRASKGYTWLSPNEIRWQDLKPATYLKIGSFTDANGLSQDRWYYRSPTGKTVYGPLNPTELNSVCEAFNKCTAVQQCPHHQDNEPCPFIEENDQSHSQDYNHAFVQVVNNQVIAYL